MLELKAVVAVVLRNFAVHLEVFFHPAEGHVDLCAGPPTFDADLVVDQAVDLFEFGTADHGRRLWRLRRVLLAADTGIARPGTGGHQGGMRQEPEGGVAGATVPQQHGDEREEGADNDEGLVVHPRSKTAHGGDLPVRHSEERMTRPALNPTRDLQEPTEAELLLPACEQISAKQYSPVFCINNCYPSHQRPTRFFAFGKPNLINAAGFPCTAPHFPHLCQHTLKYVTTVSDIKIWMLR